MVAGRDILLIILGWSLGLLGPIIIDRIKKDYQKKEIKHGLFTELQETKFRLTASVFQVTSRLGGLDKELLNWCLQHYKSQSNIHQEERIEILESIEHLLELTDEQLTAIAQTSKAEPGFGLSLKTFLLPFLDSKMGSLSLFAPGFQYLIIEIRSKLGLLNEEIEQARFFLRMTYDSTLTDENHAIIRQNVQDCYKNIRDMSRLIVERISKLLSTY